jgi:tRNA nucleotidyltransferase (CCA-adding enzyme)
MFLSDAARLCLSTLEQAGFEGYAVGGCVRDSLLGNTPHDYDLCTNAQPEETAKLFPGYTLVRSGEKHGTIGVVVDGEVIEITTFRTEGAYLDNRHPQWVTFVPHIQQDLARRDFTVNAMAYSPYKGFADPFGGRDDLNNRILRAVGDPETRFSEDSLRILRGVRFAARFGLMPEARTLSAMRSLAPLMDNLAKERVFDELSKLLLCASAEDLITFASILAQVIPELQPAIGFDQRNRHHAYDVFTHTAHVTASMPPLLPLRWAALLHDVGKVPTFTVDEDGCGHFLGHAGVGAQMANDILLRLKASTSLREDVVFLIEKHMTPLVADKKLLRRRLSQYGEGRLRMLLQLQKADFCAKGVIGDTADFEAIESILEEILSENACLSIKDLAVNGHDLMALGYTGPTIGQALQFLLEQVLDDRLPNEKAALINALKKQ